MIHKFILVGDSFRDNLQARQQQRFDFTGDTEQLFKPVTTETAKLLLSLIKIVEQSKPEETSQIGSKKRTDKERVDEIRNRFTEVALARIDMSDVSDFVNFAVMVSYDKNNYLKSEHINFIKNMTHWVHVAFNVRNQISKNNKNYPKYAAYIDAAEELYRKYKAVKEQLRKEDQLRKKEQK